jgi:hypothetical protein
MKNKRLFGVFWKTNKLPQGSIGSTVESVNNDSETKACNTMDLPPLLMSLINGDKEKQALYRDFLEAFKDAQLLLGQGDYAQARNKALRAKGCILDIDIPIALMTDLISISELENLIDKSSVKSKC